MTVKRTFHSFDSLPRHYELSVSRNREKAHHSAKVWKVMLAKSLEARKRQFRMKASQKKKMTSLCPGLKMLRQILSHKLNENIYG